MKLNLFTFFLFISIFSFTQTDAKFSISKALLCEDVKNRAPVNEKYSFSKETEKVYLFIEAENIIENTKISVHWIFEEKEKLKTEIELKKGKRWRAYCYKNLHKLSGRWKVEIKDLKGNLLKEINFNVE